MPGATTVIPFDPLKKEVLGGAIAEVMLTTAVYPISKSLPLKGAGIYALYYSGPFDAYTAIADQNKHGKFDAPIYVGQALPAGGRKGLEIVVDSAALRSRLSTHRRSIEAAVNLNVDDFHYRVLVLDDAFIRLGETSLIALFAPIWNTYIDGFGNNAPGSGRTPIKSRWDTLHPGRPQAKEHDLRDETDIQIVGEIKTVLARSVPSIDRLLISADGQSIMMGVVLSHLDDIVNLDASESN